MTRRTLAIVFLVLILIGLWACVGEVDEPNETTSEEITQAQSDDIYILFSEGENWRVYIRSSTNVPKYVILDNNGNELFTVHETRHPSFTLLNDNLLRVDWSGGSGLLISQFYDLSFPRASAEFHNLLAVDHGLVVYFVRSGHERPGTVSALVVHDIFSPHHNHISFQLDFGAYGPMGPFTAPIEFIDENTLFIAYVNSEGERVEERLVLR